MAPLCERRVVPAPWRPSGLPALGGVRVLVGTRGPDPASHCTGERVRAGTLPLHVGLAQGEVESRVVSGFGGVRPRDMASAA